MPSFPKFLPWIGKDYSSAGLDGIRLLLLGESMYAWREGALDAPDIQSQLIGEMSRDEWRRAYYTKVFQVVMGQPRKSASPASFEDFWQRIAFYNYVQFPVGTTPRIRPTEDLWNTSHDAFELIIDKYAPDAVLVLGKELWRHLDTRKSIEMLEGNLGRLTVGVKPLVSFVNHPSSGGFSSSEWSPRVAEFLDQAKTTKVQRPNDRIVEVEQSSSDQFLLWSR